MDGVDGIQCHMTNTLNTPIEAIERDYPMRVSRYEFADGTGGRGRFRGGDGLIRALTLVEGDARVSLLAERHAVPPRGAQGGGNGATGKHLLLDTSAQQARQLPAKTTQAFAVGQTLVVQTPGGGAYGEGVGEGTGPPGT
jgi:N-methylhydantoinase B